ncbi:MAG: pirin family protein [Acidimicrobiales bacterium]
MSIDGSSPIRQTIPLGTQWPTLDPFLFCAHHLDRYPESNGSLGPKPALSGRQIGQDFAGIDGWNMYHGSSVPGFPQHPHRGFETVTYVRQGWCDHSDSLGAQARFGQGDVQWLTAGGGIVHAEMFPLFDQNGPNTLHLFQIWLNLPAASKMVDPYFSMFWNHQIPKVGHDGVEVTVIAGKLGDQEPPPPPPDSWASADSDVAIWHIRLEPGASWTLPPTGPESSRVLYLFEGDGTTVAGQLGAANTCVVVDPSAEIPITAGERAAGERAAGGRPAGGGAEFLMLQGRPIDEPVAQYGPFVLNDEAGVRQAMADYQRTGFGGWPWPSDDPVHGGEAERFVRHADGRREAVAGAQR